jgi:short-subunit dehydrogenase
MKISNAAKRPRALVTGASTGIGYELAKVFAENGYDLVINSESERINAAAADLRNLGVEVTGVQADLSTREGAEELYRRATAEGPVDVLVLNAGIGAGGEFVRNDFEHELKLMNLNMVYLVYLAKLGLRDMVARKNGKLLFTSSIAADLSAPYNAVYAASKAFVQSFAQALGYELKDTESNVTVTAVPPAATETEFFERGNLADTTVGRVKKDDPAKVARDSFNALMKEKDHVVSGLKNKAQVAMSKLGTEALGAKAHGTLSKPEKLKH